jgi:hypothetical protein
MEYEPGQRAYEARWLGYPLGNGGCAPTWKALHPMHRAIWRRVEATMEAHVLERQGITAAALQAVTDAIPAAARVQESRP